MGGCHAANALKCPLFDDNDCRIGAAIEGDFADKPPDRGMGFGTQLVAITELLRTWPT